MSYTTFYIPACDTENITGFYINTAHPCPDRLVDVHESALKWQWCAIRDVWYMMWLVTLVKIKQNSSIFVRLVERTHLQNNKFIDIHDQKIYNAINKSWHVGLMVKSVLAKLSPVQKRSGFLQQSSLIKWWSSFGLMHRVGVECPRIVHQKQFSHPEDEGSPLLRNVGTFYHYRWQKPEIRWPSVQQPPQKPKIMYKIIYVYVLFILNDFYIRTYFNRNALLNHNILF
jgi:hypothetical protein